MVRVTSFPTTHVCHFSVLWRPRLRARRETVNALTSDAMQAWMIGINESLQDISGYLVTVQSTVISMTNSMRTDPGSESVSFANGVRLGGRGLHSRDMDMANSTDRTRGLCRGVFAFCHWAEWEKKFEGLEKLDTSCDEKLECRGEREAGRAER